MKNTDIQLYNQLSMELDNHSATITRLIGLTNANAKDVFIKQLIDSIRRIRYVITIADKKISMSAIDPYKEGFNPIKASTYHAKNNNLDEAVWLVFLATHFGKSKKSEWLLVQDLLKGPDENNLLSWKSVSSDLPSFRSWIEDLPNHLKNAVPKRTFSNHRKYESLRANASRPLYAVIESYTSLISSYGTHQDLFTLVLSEERGCKYSSFDNLYRKLGDVLSFGRTARFDFLTMIGKLSILEIEPPKTYMSESTGPLKGCRLLFGVNSSPARFEELLFNLNNSLSIGSFGMQVLEDALCNWQKSPIIYEHFRG